MSYNAGNHPEAFCLMQYQCEDGKGPIEWIWNSRDGVTPFTVRSPDGDGLSQHIDWGCDVYAPHYVPSIGQRVFVDLTDARCRELTDARCRYMWARHTDYFPGRSWATVDEMIAEILPTELESVGKGAPDVVVCDERMQAEFVARRATLVMRPRRYGGQRQATRRNG